MKEIERLKLALIKAGSLVYEWDIKSDKIIWSGDMNTLFGQDVASKMLDKSGLLSVIHKDDKEKFEASLRISIKNKAGYNKRFRIALDENRNLHLKDKGGFVEKGNEEFLVGVLSLNQTGAVIGLEANRKNEVEEGEFLKNKYSKREFIDKLEGAYVEAELEHKEGILLKISIDNLPMMMMWYTLEFAERIMGALEVELKRIVRNDAAVNRISVDQFGVILQDHSESEAELVIDRIVKHIQLYKNPSFEEAIHLRASIGSVGFPAHADDAEDALNKSYLALASAKNKSYEFHCDYQEAKKEQLDSRESAKKIRYMQSALKEDRMCLAFQPLIETKTGAVESYECLLRVKEDSGRYVSAGEFIPIAEKMGVIDMVDQFVLEKVVAELKEHKDIVLGFNVSNMTTDNPKWLKMCTKLLKDSDVASRMVVEITETAAQRDMRQTAYFVAALQALGCRVALDDFGAGYTSFRQLKSLSVDIVKIDGSYIMGLEENSENLMFIKTLLNFNHSYGLETVAECVENGEVAKILMGLNVDYLQGYYFGKPDILRPWAKERESYEG